MRRPAPRRLGPALGQVVRDAAPPSTLADVQRVWKAVVGGAVAAQAVPVAERAGTLTVVCESAIWRAELELSAPDLTGRLNAALAGPSDAPLKELRTRSGRIP